MPDLVVYRSTHPDVLASIEAYRAAMVTWQAAAAALLTELGFTDRGFVVATAFGFRWITGVEYRDGDCIPDGWRRVERGKSQGLVPDKRRKVGKKAHARMEDTQPPADLRASLPGMPGEQLIGGASLTPALREMAGAVWVSWRNEVSGVDPEIWERVKLSEYYALLEAEEASQ